LGYNVRRLPPWRRTQSHMTRSCLIATLCLLLFGVLGTGATAVQNPDDVRFELATKGGRKVFRVGEPIELEFRFTYSGPEPYHAIQESGGRRLAFQSRDRFIVEPAESITDPFSDYDMETWINPLLRDPEHRKLTATPTVLDRRLNEWVSLRRPGRYRITAESGSIASGTNFIILFPIDNFAPPTPRPAPPRFLSLRSNTIEIDIVDPEPGWADGVLRDATEALENTRRQSPDLPNVEPVVTIRPVESDHAPVSLGAGAVLRFLGTREAAVALVRLYETVPSDLTDIHTGLWASPHRAEVLTSILEQMKDPDVPIARWLNKTIQLAVATKAGPRLAANPHVSDPSWKQRWSAAYPEASAAIRMAAVDSVTARTGRSRALAELTIYRSEIARRDPSALPILRRIFPDLPPETQMEFFGHPNLFSVEEWKQIARAIATGPGSSRGIATVRFYELDPTAARALILDRLRNGYYDEKSHELLILPDTVLPDLDDALVTAYEQRKGIGIEAGRLLARYASSGALRRLRALYETNPHCGPVLTYFFRVDAAYASQQLAKLRETIDCAGYDPLLPMSRGLEDAAIRLLRSPGSYQRKDAATLLEYARSARAKQPLIDVWRAAQRVPERADEATTFWRALTTSNGWVLTPREFDELRAACSTEACRLAVARARQRLQETIDISSSNNLYPTVFVGPYSIHSFPDLKAKIAQFPRGTEFRIPDTEQIWPAEQQAEPLTDFLRNAGMRVAP
jgi:hypothetical protein